MQTAGPLIHGARTAIGAVAVQLTTNNSPLNIGVSIKAPVGQVNPVYVGLVGVTTLTGYPLAGGEEHLFRVNDASTLYVIGTTAEEVRFEGS